MSVPQSVRPHLIELDVRDKNWSPALAAAQQRDRQVDLRLEEFGTPILTLDLEATQANIDVMQQWVDERGALLAPHGKTTMCPALWQWQLDRGAWAITVANEAQLRVARDAGVSRVVMANEFLSPPGLAWLAGQLNADPSFEAIVWADSVAGVNQMTRHLTAAGLSRPLPVCVEIGTPGARAGVRSREQAIEVAEAVVASTVLTLHGVSAYEGAVRLPIQINSLRSTAFCRGWQTWSRIWYRDARPTSRSSPPAAVPTSTGSSSCWARPQPPPDPGWYCGRVPMSFMMTASMPDAPRRRPAAVRDSSRPRMSGRGCSRSPNRVWHCWTRGSATSHMTRVCPGR